MVETIGLLAGLLTTIGALPQIGKAYRTKSVGDVSVWMFYTILLGVLLWTVYGIVHHLWPVIIFNSISIVLNGLMIYFYHKYNIRP